MIIYFNNPYDKISVNTLQYLFINDVYPMVLSRTTPDDDKGLHISYLPTVIMCDESYKEYARIEDYKKMTPDAVNWLFARDQERAAGGTPDFSNPPVGVIIKA